MSAVPNPGADPGAKLGATAAGAPHRGGADPRHLETGAPGEQELLIPVNDARGETVMSPPVAEAVEQWRASLIELSGGSSLTDISVLGDAVVDLTAAHPSGYAQLLAGRPTRLSNLFRDARSHPVAKRRTRAVVARANELAQQYGIAPTYLAIGVATWTITESEGEVPTFDEWALARVAGHAGVPSAGVPSAGAKETRSDSPDRPASVANPVTRARHTATSTRVVQAPVLLRPLTITPHGDGEADYDLVLDQSAEINPVLARTLRARGALIDSSVLAHSATMDGFEPTLALEGIASLGASCLPDFQMTARVLAGTFVHPGQILVDDIEELAEGGELDQHEVIAAVAGSVPALASVRIPLPPTQTGDPDPARERGVGDLDPSQRHVVDVLASGSHLFVDAPIGSDVAGTVAAVVAEAAASGRSVLYVPGHRRAADRLLARLGELGLESIALDVAPTPGWRQSVSNRLLSAMAVESERTTDEESARIRDALLGARAQLSGYIEALHLIRQPWGVSAYDALQALARLTADRPGPSTTVRLSREIILSIGDEKRRAFAADLVRAADLGAFSRRSIVTPWAGANLTSASQAQDAVIRVQRLREYTLPRLREQVDTVTELTGLTKATNLRQWGEQLAMLSGMRETLDVFQPKAFERSAQLMVEATATKQWRAEHNVEMSGTARRRLQRQARDMLRPGVRVPDLHEALVKVEEQRKVWFSQCPRGGWPVLPEGLSAIEDTFEAVRIDFDDLEPYLPAAVRGQGVMTVPLEDLTARLDALADAREDLEELPARTLVVRALWEAGLSDLLTDLATREVPPELVGAELELAWWSSVFEQILDSEPILAGQDSEGLEALARRFRELDRKHIQTLATPVRTAVRDFIAVAMRDHREQSEELFTELLEGRLTNMRELAAKFPDVLGRLRPVLIATPTLVPHLLPASRSIDLVVIDAAEHAPFELMVPAIARARQIMVIGDRRAASESTVSKMAETLPTVNLVVPGSTRDPYITGLLADHGYRGAIRPAPMPRPQVLVRFDVVDGQGMPDPTTGSVESTQAEVERVVELAIEYAVTRPDESFAIVTATATHADRIRDALMVEVRRNPALASYFSAVRAEPALTTDITAVAGLSRDTIVFSPGFGKTPHGRVLHRFGVLNTDGGEALLLSALGAARHRVHVVSSFTVADLDPERLRGRGAKLLAEVLRLTEERDGAEDQVALGNGVDIGGTPDRLVLDLAERLWRAGLIVETNYGIADGDRIPLVVGHPDLPGELLLAVLTDDDAYVAEPSIRVRDRQVAERLERLGWVVAQVWSAAAFLDPAREAERLRRAVQAVRDARIPDGRGTAQAAGRENVVVVPLIDLGDDGQ